MDIVGKEEYESIAYCLDCDDTRIISNTGACVTCSSKQIHRNGTAKLLKAAKDKYTEDRTSILKEAMYINRTYSKEFKGE